MGKLQQKQKPNRQHSPKIPTRHPNRIHHLPRNRPRHRKKTQPKLLEHHKQKIPRLRNRRKRPTNILVHYTEANNSPTEHTPNLIFRLKNLLAKRITDPVQINPI
mgnify:CR=1 FL=1